MGSLNHQNLTGLYAHGTRAPKCEPDDVTAGAESFGVHMFLFGRPVVSFHRSGVPRRLRGSLHGQPSLHSSGAAQLLGATAVQLPLLVVDITRVPNTPPPK
eukprot:gene7776-biopygen18071